MSGHDERARRRSSRPPLCDPELQRIVDESDELRLSLFDELDDLTQRIDRTVERINRLPTDGVIIEPMAEDDSLIQHVAAARGVDDRSRR